MMVCAQPDSLGSMSRGWRWMVFAVGVVEAMLWSGTIYGWASLVHVLKLQGVYYSLCSKDQLEYISYGSSQDAHNTSALTPIDRNQVRASALYSSTACSFYLCPINQLKHLGLDSTAIHT